MVPFKYLGLEVGGNPRKKQFWEPTINRINYKLSAWKGRFLSLAGRICLVESVFSSLPLFYLSFFKALEVVYSKIISIQMRFLWGWGREKSSISWVSWENLYKPLEEGGLGIKYIRNFNTTLLAKWKWRILGEEKGKLKDSILSKYGMMHRHYQLPLKYQSWWWRDLCKSCGEEKEEDWFRGALEWKVGSGDKIRF